MAVLPTGTVTFLFTDIEGSTKLLQGLGDRYELALAAHATVMREAIAAGGGVEVNTEGDSFFAAFPSADGAVAAAVQAQQALAAHPWPDGADVRVRMGLHTGNGVLGGDDYVGIDVHRAARIAGTAHGGQVVLSRTTAHLAEQALPPGVLLRDLGDHRLKDFEGPERIYQLAVDGLPADFPPLSGRIGVPHNLPTRRGTFVGRQRELADALDLLAASRVLTLTGPGGIGKTRLSLEIASEALERFPDGVFFVPLGSVTDDEGIWHAVLDALSVPPSTRGTDPERQVLERLSAQEMLLVLDNMEQLVESGPALLTLLEAAPAAKLLVTTRAPLRITGEQEMAVPQLGDVDAVALFAERATAVRPGFTVDDDHAAAVAGIVSRLDGLPLALELAASRMKMLPPESILERLDSVMQGAGSRDLPERQQTMRSTIDWSYQLLDAPGRRLFARLSVFAGSADLDQIEAVCGPADELGADVLDTLTVLVDNSLVVPTEQPGLPRFRMLRTIGQFAAEKLEEHGEAEDIARRHAAAYLALAEQAAPELTRKDRIRWLDRLTLDAPNLSGAMSWSIGARETDVALRLLWALWRFWQMRGHLREVASRIDTVLALEGGGPKERAAALEAAGGIAYWLADVPVARRYYEQSLELWRQAGDEQGIARALFNLAFPVAFTEGPDTARPLLDDAHDRFERQGDRAGMGRVYRLLGVFSARRGDMESWLDLCKRSLEQFDAEEEPFDYGWSLFSLAGASIKTGDVDAVGPLLDRGLEIFAAADDVSAILLFLSGYVELARVREEDERAARLAGAATRLRTETGVSMSANPLGAIWLNVENIDTLAAAASPEFREGRDMPTDEAVAYALRR